MASAKRTPKVSRISRDRTVAYVRKKKSASDDGAGDDGASDGAEAEARTEAPEQAAGSDEAITRQEAPVSATDQAPVQPDQKITAPSAQAPEQKSASGDNAPAP